MIKKGAYFTWLLLLLLIDGCVATRHTAGLDIDTIRISVDPNSRYSGEWGQIETLREGCIDLTGEYVVVSSPGKNNPDGGPYGANGRVGLGNLVRLQSHNDPLKYGLAEKKSVLIKGHGNNSPIEFNFLVEVVPFVGKLENYTCANGWTRIQYEEDFGSEGGWINYIGDVYLSKTSDGDLVVFHRSWSKNTTFLGLHRYEKSQEHWFLYKAHEK